MSTKTIASWFMIVGLFSGCSIGGRSSAPSPGEDTKRLQGSWKLTGAIYNGQPMGAVAIEDTRLTVDGDQYTMTHNGTTESSTFTLGASGPRTIRVFHHENPLASQEFYGGTLTGIYEISADRLRICFDMTGRQYPKSFDASQGSRRIICKFVRESH